MAGGLTVAKPETTFGIIANITSSNTTELTNSEVDITVVILANVVVSTTQNTSEVTDKAIEVFSI